MTYPRLHLDKMMPGGYSWPYNIKAPLRSFYDLPTRRVADRFPLNAPTLGYCMRERAESACPFYSLHGELTPVIFVPADGKVSDFGNF